MKQLYTLILLITFSTLIFAQGTEVSRTLEVHADKAVFETPEGKKYVDVSFIIPGRNLEYIEQGNQFQAEVEMLLMLKKGEKIVDFKKFKLKSPLSDDKAIKFDLVGLKRFELNDTEKYDFEISVKDLNQNEVVGTTKLAVAATVNNKKVHSSDIQLVESLSASTDVNEKTKAGYQIIPQPVRLYLTGMNEMNFYTEIYNTNKSSEKVFLISYSVTDLKTKEVVANLSRFQKIESAEVVPFFGKLDISKLTSGKYSLDFEVKDKRNLSLNKESLEFYRVNKDLDISEVALSQESLNNIDLSNTFVANMTNEDLRFSIDALRPIMTQREERYVKTVLRENKDNMMKSFLYRFWTARAPGETKAEYDIYMLAIEEVDEIYGTPNREGYESDRGRIFLRYGSPAQIDRFNNEPNKYPHEIWQYYEIDGLVKQTNVEFIFASRDIVTNEFEIIHSTAKGEVRDERWRFKVRKTNSADFDNDGSEMDGIFQDTFGGDNN